MPILALADQEIETTLKARNVPDYPADPLGELLGMRKSGLSVMGLRQPRVIAFTDPNDLLSYALARSTQVQPFSVVDAIVSNQKTLFGYLERPDTAHTAYLQNEAVNRLIACGTGGCP